MRQVASRYAGSAGSNVGDLRGGERLLYCLPKLPKPGSTVIGAPPIMNSLSSGSPTLRTDHDHLSGRVRGPPRDDLRREEGVAMGMNAEAVESLLEWLRSSQA